MALKTILLLAFSLTLCSGRKLCECEEPQPRWSPSYTVAGTIYIPRNDIKEPFRAWYDGLKRLSRIDYYDGAVRTFQIYKSLYQFFPYSNETTPQAFACIATSANEDVTVQTVLPDLTGFQLNGSELLRDTQASKWQLRVEDERYVYQHTLWVTYDKREGTIPLKYEVRKYNTARGSQVDYFYFDYTHYSVNHFNTNIFSVRGVADKCETIGNYYNDQLNPMKRFMNPQDFKYVSEEFDRFKVEHDRQYASDLEHEERKNIFYQNLRYIESHNRAGRGFVMGVNHLADRTPEELGAMTGLRYTDDLSDNEGLTFPYSEAEVQELSEQLPKQFDWRPTGAVTPVKDQMSCRSFWAFAAVGVVESALFLRRGRKDLVRLSEQALVDCSWGSNKGCFTGIPEAAFAWIRGNGLPTDAEYGGYLGLPGYCHMNNVNTTTHIDAWYSVPAGNETALQLAIYKHGPVAVCFVVSESFHFYKEGVYYEELCDSNRNRLSHCALAVGYGVLGKEKYWIIKNSQGAQWGNDGYILMSANNNNCDVLTRASYVVISK